MITYVLDTTIATTTAMTTAIALRRCPTAGSACGAMAESSASSASTALSADRPVNARHSSSQPPMGSSSSP